MALPLIEPNVNNEQFRTGVAFNRIISPWRSRNGLKGVMATISFEFVFIKLTKLTISRNQLIEYMSGFSQYEDGTPFENPRYIQYINVLFEDAFDIKYVDGIVYLKSNIPIDHDYCFEDTLWEGFPGSEGVYPDSTGKNELGLIGVNYLNCILDFKLGDKNGNICLYSTLHQMELNGNDLYYEITTTNVKDSMLYILKYNNGLFQISGNYFSNKMDVIHELIYEDYYVLYIEYGSDTDHEESGLIYENNFTSVAINRM